MSLAPVRWRPSEVLAGAPHTIGTIDVSPWIDGGYVVAYRGNGGSFVMRHDALGNALDATPIAVGQFWSSISVTTLDDGTIIVVGDRLDGAFPQVNAVVSVLAADGSVILSITTLNSSTANFQGLAEVAAFNGSQAVAIWQDTNSSSGGGGDMFSRSISSTGVLGPETKVNANGDSVYQSNGKASSLTQSDGVILAWQEQGSIKFKFVTGGGYSNELPGPATGYDFDVHVLPDGTIVFAYARFVSAQVGWVVEAMRYSSDGTQVLNSPGSSTIAVSTGGLLSHQPKVEVTNFADGGFMVAWTTINANGAATGDLLGRAFDAVGNPLNTQPFAANDTMSGNGVAPALATLADGRVVFLYGSEDNFVADISTQIWDPRVVVPLGTAGNDGIGGNESVNTIFGLGGNDTLSGEGGADSLVGGTGNDHLEGGAGDDQLSGGNGDDYLRGDQGNDTLDGNSGQHDVADYSASNAGVSVSLASGGTASGGHAEGDTLLGIEDITGSDFIDSLTGNSLRNTLRGGDGNDVMNGSSNNDKLYGGDGDDMLFGGTGADVIEGGSNTSVGDTVSYANADARIILALVNGAGTASGSGQAGGDTLAGIENVTGTIFNDIITGDASNNVIAGLAGNDTLKGGDGNDDISGGGGLDRITGGAGGDILRGGPDADTFVYDTLTWGHDQIIGWQNGIDKVDLMGVGFDFGDFTKTLSGGDTLLTFTADTAHTIRFVGVSNINQIDLTDFI